MINTIKGWIKRLTTPKKNKTYQPEQDNYGEFEWRFISSFNVDIINNIILELDISPSCIDTDNNVSSLIENAQLSGLRILKYTFENKICIFFAGAKANYISLLSIDNSVVYISNNRILKSMISILQKIDIMHSSYEIDNVLPYTSTYNIESMYLPYLTDTKEISCTDPITIQSLPTENIYHEVLKTDYMSKFIYLMIIAIYNEKELEKYYISDLVNLLNFSNFYQETFAYYKRTLHSNFDIPGFKNIFDINLKVTDDDESMYDDIDEVIE